MGKDIQGRGNGPGMGLHMTISLGLNVEFAAMHRSIHISVTTSLPPYPTGASSRGTLNGITVKLFDVTCVDPGRGFVNIKPWFLVITSARTSF